MKKILVVCMLMVTVSVIAQRREGHDRTSMKDLTAEQIGTLNAKKATLALDLTAKQQEQMQALLTENAKMRKTKMEERKAQKESGATKAMTTEQRYERANERLDYQIAQKEKLKNILSDEQLAKWEKMQQRKGQRRKGIGTKKKGQQDKSQE